MTYSYWQQLPLAQIARMSIAAEFVALTASWRTLKTFTKTEYFLVATSTTTAVDENLLLLFTLPGKINESSMGVVYLQTVMHLQKRAAGASPSL